MEYTSALLLTNDTKTYRHNDSNHTLLTVENLKGNDC